jgi:two-component system, chemotaxis family, CheB/CheR fusion protein
LDPHQLDEGSPPEASANLRSSFPIVGVGASAGGLSATLELLSHLGAEPNLALVIVHHLDPTRESSLGEILAKATPMPVHIASDGLLVEPSHVYVLPPNAELQLAAGVLRVTPRPTSGLHLPIDHFFESLAADCALGAVGVVLTGSGADGAQGVRAIKAEGGITFAQDRSAEYRSMPDSAIATGCVDFVSSLAGIAQQLLRIAQHVPPLTDALRDAPAEVDFQRILAILMQSTGIDFANYKRTTVQRRVQRRLLVHGLRDMHRYVELLTERPEEIGVLCEDLLIRVTSFFRDAAAFDLLKTLVFPKLLERRPRDAGIRVWVPGCATGEEVYSIAISLLEFLSEAQASDVTLKLFGTDVSVTAIERARAGQYLTSIERDVSPGRLRRFFSKLDGSYRICKEIRELCVFARHDATRDPPFSGMDLVSCRNMMIYLGPALQDRILPTLHYALKEPGFLLLGASETTRSFPGFVLLDAKHKIYARSSAAPRALPSALAPQRMAAVPPHAIAPTGLAGKLDIHREADRIVLTEFAPPGIVVSDDLAIIEFRGKTGHFLEPAAGVASFELLRMVREELRMPLRQTIELARTTRTTARKANVPTGTGATARVIELEVIPFAVPASRQRYFVVLFKEPPGSAVVSEPAATSQEDAAAGGERELARELASTRDYLQSVIERLEASNDELKAANEEIVSNNEELLSTNEELQMAKEQLEATNEELHTVNEEMNVRNLEATRLNDDLSNVLNSVEIPIVILGRDSRLRRYTPAAAELFDLMANDIGRTIHGLLPVVSEPELTLMVTEVLDHLSALSRTLQASDGHWYQLELHPYVTADSRIDGAVLSFFDIDQLKKGEQLIAQAREYAENIVDTVAECLIVLDREQRVRSANRAFCETFQLKAAELEGQSLYALGGGEWNMPVLRECLQKLCAGESFQGLRIEREFASCGFRVFLVNARQIQPTALILLALEDITERERAKQEIERTEQGFRDMLTNAAEAIVMSDAEGTIVFVNRMATETFGYAADELIGRPLATLLPEGAREHHARLYADFIEQPVSRQMGRDRRLVGRRKDGSEFSLEITLAPMARDGKPIVVSFITDASQRQAAEVRIRDYQRKLQQMAFDAAVAEERERRRIGADLHDRIGQGLALAQIKLTSMRAAVQGASRTALDEAVELLAQSVADTRTLTFELSPPVLYDLGLKAALSWLVEDFEKRHGMRVELEDDGQDKPLDDASAALVYRSVRELLLNVFKHAGVPAAKIVLRRVGGELQIEVKDGGAGFELDDITLPTATSGFGLFSVREQISRLGGHVQIASAPQQGSCVSLRVPLKLAAVPPMAVAEKPT